MASRLPYKDDDAENAVNDAARKPELRICYKCNRPTARRLTSGEFEGLPEPTRRAMDLGYIDLWYCPCGCYQNAPRASE